MLDDERDTVLFTVSPEVVVVAVRCTQGCEQCRPEEAEMPFNIVLDAVLGFSGAHTDYFMVEVGKCPRCRGDIHETTLVEWDGGIEIGEAVVTRIL